MGYVAVSKVGSAISVSRVSGGDVREDASEFNALERCILRFRACDGNPVYRVVRTSCKLIGSLYRDGGFVVCL